MTGVPDAEPDRLTEHGLIERYFKPVATVPGAFALLDDAAAYRPDSGTDLVLTKDGIAEGIHFLSDDPPDAIARKALRVNLSDLAAKGAVPAGFLLLLGLAPDWSEDWVAGFAAGLKADQDKYAIPLYGGDTIRAPGLVISITAFGTVASGRMVRRAGAAPGDRLYVSGTIGDGALGLLVATGDQRVASLAPADRDNLLARYRLPQPRTGLAAAVAAHASAAMDVSDGLVGDLDKLCRASGVSARVEAEAVPLSASAKALVEADPDLKSLCLTGGDDYEILCTVPPGGADAFESATAEAGTPVAAIGKITAGTDEPAFCDAAGEPIRFAHRAFSHVGMRAEHIR